MDLRPRIILIVFLVAFFAAIGRLFFLQVMTAERYEAAAEQQHVLQETVLPERGSIYFRSSPKEEESPIPAAISKRWWQVWAIPQKIAQEDRENLAEQVADILDLDKEMIVERFAKENDPYEPLKEKVGEGAIEKLADLENPAIGWREYQDRFYPLDTVGAHVLGFVGNRDNQRIGQYGLEKFYSGELSGKEGFVSGFRNPFGILIRPFSNVADPTDGADLFTTIDYNVQLMLEEKLAEAQDRYDARSATGIVVDPKTGAVRAMASVPSFNPNTYAEVEDISHFTNPAIQRRFEPGSIFKPITMAIGIDTNVISPDLTYTDEGEVEVRDATIKNATGESFGEQTMTQVLEKSLNTGAVFAVRRIPGGVWREYLENFAFDGRTGIDLAGEVEGDLGDIRPGREVEIATSAFGQGIAVTPLSITMAMAAIANGGELLTPYVVERARPDKAPEETIGEKTVRRRVIEKETAEKVAQMMVSVVENGARRAQIAGYSVAGKTGTAQIPSPQGGYLEDTIHSFIGFAPAFNPAFVTLITIEGPQGVEYSSQSAAPVFGEVAEFILRYYEIEPDKPLVN